MKLLRLILSVIFVPCLPMVGCNQTFDQIRTQSMIASGKVFTLSNPDGGKVLVTPGLMGRALTARVGSISSVGYVSLREIEAGPRDVPWNNYGGLDRFWVGPETGEFGIFFKPGVKLEMENWRVPEDLNKGGMKKVESEVDQEGVITLTKNMTFRNFSGTEFQIKATREIGIIPSDKLNEELGTLLPDGVSFVGSYSMNTLTNIGEDKWEKENGLLNIWILGQFNAGPKTLVIAPSRPGDESELGSRFTDKYLGELSKDAPDRIKVIDNAIIFRADARLESKFGLNPNRSTGFAGSYDPMSKLLIIVKFDVHSKSDLYADFTWKTDDPDPFKGDVFQSYNSGGEKPGQISSHPFYELESTSPCKELNPNEEIIHRHATFCFVGDPGNLEKLAEKVLGVSLQKVVTQMLDGGPLTPRQ